MKFKMLAPAIIAGYTREKGEIVDVAALGERNIVEFVNCARRDPSVLVPHDDEAKAVLAAPADARIVVEVRTVTTPLTRDDSASPKKKGKEV
jgi:hypothetical protein